MKELAKWFKSVQGIWKKLVVLSTWLLSIIGTFILPLPKWGSEAEHSAQMHFILFIATGLSGFTYILVIRNQKISIWLVISLISFVSIIGMYFFNDYLRETKTEQYYQDVLIIGNDYTQDAIKLLDSTSVSKRKMIQDAAGDLTRIWTKESIYRNKWILILGQALTYSFATVFVISITNLILLNAPKKKL